MPDYKLETSTGRSGINLDGGGGKNGFYWVFDGVSPIVLRRKDTWLFRAFFHDKQNLASALAEMTQSSRIDFRALHKLLLAHRKGNSPLFRVLRTPLYSLIVIKAQSSDQYNVQIEYAMYGDCGMIYHNNDHVDLILNNSLEKTKIWIDSHLSWVSLFIKNENVARIYRLMLFSLIRIFQIFFGYLTIFGGRHFFTAPVKGNLKVPLESELLLFSDGATAPLLKKAMTASDYLSVARSEGLASLITEVRHADESSVSFGRNDDITFLRLNFHEDDK